MNSTFWVTTGNNVIRQSKVVREQETAFSYLQKFPGVAFDQATEEEH